MQQGQKLSFLIHLAKAAEIFGSKGHFQISDSTNIKKFKTSRYLIRLVFPNKIFSSKKNNQ